jgi:serine/threonine protein kinase
MLEKNPYKRPTPVEALKHEWFKSDKKVLKDLIKINDLNRRQDSEKIRRFYNGQVHRSIYRKMGVDLKSHIGSFLIGPNFNGNENTMVAKKTLKSYMRNTSVEYVVN